MNVYIDTIMLILFILFMVFVFGGYHKAKSAQRELDKENELQKSEKSLK